MTFHEADPISLLVFSFFSVLMFIMIARATLQIPKSAKYLIFFAAYVVVISLFAISGLIKDHVIPLVPIVMLSIPLTSLALSQMRLGQEMASKFSFSVLIGFHAFRFPLELILHHWAKIQVIPETMTWSGQNPDILTGIIALILAPFATRHQWARWTFQIIGIALLLNVLRVVMFSLPLPFSWSLENPLQLPFYFPYVLIGPLFVWPALYAHAVLMRKMILN